MMTARLAVLCFVAAALAIVAEASASADIATSLSGIAQLDAEQDTDSASSTCGAGLRHLRRSLDEVIADRTAQFWQHEHSLRRAPPSSDGADLIPLPPSATGTGAGAALARHRDDDESVRLRQLHAQRALERDTALRDGRERLAVHAGLRHRRRTPGGPSPVGRAARSLREFVTWLDAALLLAIIVALLAKLVCVQSRSQPTPSQDAAPAQGARRAVAAS
jgi:hypothetical protein